MSPRFSVRVLAAQSDERLAALVGEGHDRAFETLAKRYRRRLLRYCRHIGLAESGAEDVVQQALLQAWLALAAGRDVEHVKAWLYRIAHNAALNSRRGALASRVQLGEAGRHHAAVAPGSDLDSVVAARCALGEMATLPALQRRAIVLTALEGQTHEEVAGILGVSSAAVRGLVYRARSSLRSAAAALMPQPLVAWAVGAAGGGAPTVQRLTEVAGGGGGASTLAAVLVKGGVAAVTAGVLATSAGVVQLKMAGTSEAPQAPRAAGVASSGGMAVRRGPYDLRASSPESAIRAHERRGSSQPGWRGRRGEEGRRRRTASPRDMTPRSGDDLLSPRLGASARKPAERGGDAVADDHSASSAISGPSSDGGSGSSGSGGSSSGDATSSQLATSQPGPGPSGGDGSSSGSGGLSDDGRSGSGEAPLTPSDGGGSSGTGGSGTSLAG